MWWLTNVRTLLLILWNERTTSKSEDTTLARKQPLPPGEPAGSGGKPQRPAAPAIPRGSAQKHFHTDAPTGRRCESAFALLSHRESNKEVLPPRGDYGKMGAVRDTDDRKDG